MGVRRIFCRGGTTPKKVPIKTNRPLRSQNEKIAKRPLHGLFFLLIVISMGARAYSSITIDTLNSKLPTRKKIGY